MDGAEERLAPRLQVLEPRLQAVEEEEQGEEVEEKEEMELISAAAAAET